MEESACAITALASALGVPAPPAPQQRPAEAAPSAARAPTPPPREGVGMFGALLALRPLELPLRGGDGKSAGRERVRKGAVLLVRPEDKSTLSDGRIVPSTSALRRWRPCVERICERKPADDHTQCATTG